MEVILSKSMKLLAQYNISFSLRRCLENQTEFLDRESYSDFKSIRHEPLKLHAFRKPFKHVLKNAKMKIERSMTHRHICPCCSDVLLRQMHSGKLCWHCSYCFQDMPV